MEFIRPHTNREFNILSKLNSKEYCNFTDFIHAADCIQNITIGSLMINDLRSSGLISMNPNKGGSSRVITYNITLAGIHSLENMEFCKLHAFREFDVLRYIKRIGRCTMSTIAYQFEYELDYDSNIVSIYDKEKHIAIAKVIASDLEDMNLIRNEYRPMYIENYNKIYSISLEGEKVLREPIEEFIKLTQ